MKLDIQDIQYLNLFSKITKVRATNCFNYNSHLVFVVKPQNMMRAVGNNGINVRRISENIGKKIKIVAMPPKHISNYDIRKFVLSIVHPVRFKQLINNNGEVIIHAGGIQTRAMLIGRESSKINELKDILRQYFNIKSVRIA